LLGKIEAVATQTGRKALLPMGLGGATLKALQTRLALEVTFLKNGPDTKNRGTKRKNGSKSTDGDRNGKRR
jgi:hypothetical protein